MIIVSACLAGFHCRWDGGSTPDSRVIELVKAGKAMPLCPEQLGGLSTPRARAELKAGRVITEEGTDVTREYERGAREVLAAARLTGSKKAILKSLSPSCGCGTIYDGTHSGTLIPGEGICAALLKQHSFEVVTEKELE